MASALGQQSRNSDPPTPRSQELSVSDQRRFRPRQLRGLAHEPEPVDFVALLEQAGFKIRGRRADCPFCQGSARFTVAFTNEVAFCHRCKWTGNIRTLTRELGLPLEPLTREIHEKREQRDRFGEWERTIYLLLVQKWRSLTHRAELAKQVLLRFPDCEPAWWALADLYHSESTFGAAFEFLLYERLPQYVEAPMTRDQLLAAFSEAERRMRDVA